MSVLLDEETVVLEALDFDLECWHQGHTAEWSVACRFCGQHVNLCDEHLEDVRLKYLISISAGRRPNCVTCKAHRPTFDELFEAVPL